MNTDKLLFDLNKRALALVEIYDYYEQIGEEIDKAKIDAMSDKQLDDLYSHCLWEKEMLDVQEGKDIKNGLYGEEY